MGHGLPEASRKPLANTKGKWFYPVSLRAGELMHISILTTLALGLLMNAALADTPLSPGKPAGVQQAQLTNRNLEYLFIGVGLVVGVGAAIVLEKNHSTSSSSTASP